jgi:hypothetical protein
MLFTMVALPGCQLESEIYDAINPTVFPKTAADAEALVAGNVYAHFTNEFGWLYGQYQGVITLNELASDISESGGWRHHEPLLYGRWLASQNLGMINNLWQGIKYISAMALTIDRISGIDMDETYKNRLIAEVRCGRGFLSFLMYDIFGPLPLPDLEILKNPREEKILPRATEEEMQAFIETELWAAANAPELPAVYKKGDAGYGRFSKGVCYMVLLKFYMQTRQWDKAITAGRELMKPEYGYDLVPRYKDIFTLAHEKNVETIFSYNCMTGYTAQSWHPQVLPSDYPTDPPGLITKMDGWKLLWWFVHTYEEGDGRLETIVTKYTSHGGVEHTETLDAGGTIALRYGAIPFKYEIDPATNGWESQIDWIIYRYADALTLLAEAIVRKDNAVTAEAIQLLNRVRTRAGLTGYTLGDFSGWRDFLDKLLMERAHEHYWEGCRRQDLIRDGSYVEAMVRKSQVMGQTTLVDKAPFPDTYTRFPLPQGVIDEGKGLILQNPGY